MEIANINRIIVKTYITALRANVHILDVIKPITLTAHFGNVHPYLLRHSNSSSLMSQYG